MSRELPPLTVDQPVRVQDPISKRWKPGKVTEILPEPRSYKVNTQTGPLRRNRRHIRTTKEKFGKIEEPPVSDEVEPPEPPPQLELQPPPTPPKKVPDIIQPRRSGRTIVPPVKLDI